MLVLKQVDSLEQVGLRRRKEEQMGEEGLPEAEEASFEAVLFLTHYCYIST
jgi:hypothetical protein